MIKLSIIMPVYSEEDTIVTCIDRIDKVKFAHNDVEKELIIVDDGSLDDTLKKIPDLDYIKIFRHAENRGKGAAIKTGISVATGDIIIIQDADLETDPNDYERLVRPIIENKAQVVYGSRFKKAWIPEGMRFSRLIFNWSISFVTSLLFFQHITDESTCYKVFKADILKSIPLQSKRFEFCPEVTAKVLKRKIKIKEVPTSYNARTHEEGQKTRWWDGVEAFYYLFKYRFTD